MSEETERQIRSIDGLIQQLGTAPDPFVRALSKQLIQALMDLHGAALERMLELVHEGSEVGQKIIDEMGRDDLVGSLLLLYGLHPLDVQTRILQSLEKARPLLRSQGGDVQFVGMSEAGEVTLRVEGESRGCSASPDGLRSTVERIVYDAAPDVTAIVIEGVPANGTSAGAFVPLASLQGAR